MSLNSTKDLIRGLLTAIPNMITVQELCKEYKNTVGEPIPYHKMGYNSAEHFFQSIPDTVQLQGSGPLARVNLVRSVKSAHVSEMVDKQKRDTKKAYNRFTRTPLMRRTTVNAPKQQESPKLQEAPPTRPKIIYPSTSKSRAIESNINPPSSNIHKSTKDKDSDNKNNLINNDQDTDEQEDTWKSGRTNITRNKFIKKSPNNVNQLIYQTEEDYIPDGMKNNLKVLIGFYPNGVWCAQLPLIYKEMFRRPLNYQDLGFAKVIDLCIKLKGIFHCIQPGTEDYKLYDKSKPLPADCIINTKISSEKSVTAALPRLEWSDFITGLPDDVFKPGEEIPRTFVKKETKENDSIAILVQEVYDVSKFWISLDDEKLNDLMDEMQTFYISNADEYKLPTDFIREGVYCVAIIYGEYHRALIVDTLPQCDEIRVFFIDYGSVTKISPEIYYLHNRFAKLPAQTIRCRLGNIYPPVKGAPWSQECTKEFRELIRNKTLVAKISRINWKDQYLEICLADVTDGKNVFFINDVLVEKGLAIYLDQEQTVNTVVTPLVKPIVSFIHLFPTFMELETGLAPSTLEMEVFHKCSVPINFCYPQYFSIDCTDEENVIKHVMNFYGTKIKKRHRDRIHTYKNAQLSWDSSNIKNNGFNFSIFGPLEDEIRQFITRNDLEVEEEYYEDDSCAYAEEDPCLVKESILSENVTINMLKSDVGLSEDILFDLKKQLCIEDSLEPSDELIDEETSNPGNQSNLGFDGFETKSIKNESSKEVAEFSLNLPDYSDQIKSTNPFLFDICNSADMSDREITSNDGRLHPTNPFLSFVQEPKCDNVEGTSSSSSSTDYGIYIQEVKMEKWSTVDHYSDSPGHSTDAVDSSANDNMQESNDSDSTEEPDRSVNVDNTMQMQPMQNTNVHRPSFNVNSPAFYPQNCFNSMPYGYRPVYHTNFPAFRFPTQYYPQHYNQQVIMSSINVTQKTPIPAEGQKLICPPPGFQPNSNYFKPPIVDCVQNMDFYEAYNKLLRSKYS